MRAGGTSCLPLLLRGLRSADERLARWSGSLLIRLGGSRVVHELSQLAADEAAPDPVRSIARSLLLELGAAPPAEAPVDDPDRVIARSVHELIDGLRGRADVAQAAELVAAQIAEPEIPGFCAELIRHGGRRAGELVRAIAGQQLSSATLQELHQLLGNAPVAHARRSSTSSLIDWVAPGSAAHRQPGNPTERRLESALRRGILMLENAEPQRALGLLERFVQANPEDAEGRSSLGLCLLALERLTPALGQLEQACRIEPTCVLHQWNLAAAAQKAGRVGRCYLALRAYLAGQDGGPGAEPRRAEARSYVAEYEQAMGENHPGVDPLRVARGEELFILANSALATGAANQAIPDFEKVLRLVPEHYPAWSQLGYAYAAVDEREAARECFQRALELCLDYEPALRGLTELGGHGEPS
jgi:tetratricopeptide (TPR) repeat protein